MDRRAFRHAVTTRTAASVLRIADTSGGRRVGRYVGVLHGLFNNDSGNIELNGEAWLLSQLGPCSTVFDVGANRGDWTREALQRLPDASVHCFEPIPETFVELARGVGGNDRVHLHNVALSNQVGELRMWADEGDRMMSSATGPPGRSCRELVVPCTTGDEYMRSHAIDHIDFLKIDVEGHEMEVLEGFRQAFGAGAIDVVQFEFTLWAAVARRWLADYYEFFSQWDFRVGKLWPRSVQWMEYAAESERFFRNNFVAFRHDSDAARILGVP